MRLTSLDSLRGIAALTVVLYHCEQFFAASAGPIPHWLQYSPLRVLFSGHGAVMVFFALSGFVLFLTFQKIDHFEYYPYAVKRFMRIFPPFAFAILASAALCMLAGPHQIPILQDEFGQVLDWTRWPTAKLIVGHLLMTDKAGLQFLDPPMWSLVHELRISAIFPLIAWCVLRNWGLTVVTSLVISFGCVFVSRTHPMDWPYQPLVTLQYIFLFATGAALSLKSSSVQGLILRLPPPVRAGGWTAALLMITCSSKTLLGYLAFFAAVLLVALCFADPIAQRVLSVSVLRWLGRISYSLYLVHMPILFTLVHFCWGRLPLFVILLAAFVLSLGSAELMYRFVERPSINLGRRIAAMPRYAFGSRFGTQEP